MQLSTLRKKRRIANNILRTAIAGVLFSACVTQAENCRPNYTIGDELLHLPCLDWLSDSTSRTVYQADLRLIEVDTFLFAWESKTVLPEPSTEVGAIFEPDSKSLFIPDIDVQTAPGVIQAYQVMLQEISGNILSLTQAKLIPSSSNHQPIAMPTSMEIDSGSLYQPIQLMGNDSDGDTLAFELLAPSSGLGYTLAYITPQNILYVMIAQDFTGTIELSYRVTDSKIFSQPATITIVVKTKEDNTDFFFGSERVEAREFAQHSRRGFPRASLTGTSPSSVDLSSQFPTPGNQGKQGSCVAWSIAYATKSYQEGIEENWSLDSQDHLFSPAFVYNQLISGATPGLKVSDVLDWVVTNSISTWATMPYDENDSTSQPNKAALQEAKYYPSDSWATVSSTNEMKTALVNGQPVIITFAVFNSLLNLKGDASIYNTADTFVDEHAATVVGYDDNHTSGGAFKVMNSWGTEWGDNGFFWLPYQFISTRVTIDGKDTGDLISGAYVLVDKDNASLSSSTETIAPPSLDDLPNLLVADLQVSYDNLKPNAQSQLQYTIVNDGTVAVPADSVWVELILSKNPSQKTDYHEDDYYWLATDMVPFELAPGQSVTRTEIGNEEPFVFPEEIMPGEYYLHLIVNGYDGKSEQVLTESTKSDNIKTAEGGPLTVFGEVLPVNVDNLPNLTIKSWEVNYDTFQRGAESELQYVIENNGLGTVPANSAKVDLILSNNPNPTIMDYLSDDIYYLTTESIENELAMGQAVNRTGTNTLPFVVPSNIPPGDYYLHLVVDAFDKSNNKRLRETNIKDNISSSAKLLTLDDSNPLPDLRTRFWFAEWDHTTGEGKLDYAIENIGTGIAQPSLSISLVLFSLEKDEQGKPIKEFTLWRKSITEPLPVGFDSADPVNQPTPFYVDSRTPESFNIYKDVNGKEIPMGNYDVLFRLDDDNNLEEYDDDNLFYGGITVKVVASNSRSGLRGNSQAYNGKRLRHSKSTRQMRIEDRLGGFEVDNKHIFSKKIRSSDYHFSPIGEMINMPKIKME